jgi:hypothetical protein
MAAPSPAAADYQCIVKAPAAGGIAAGCARAPVGSSSLVRTREAAREATAGAPGAPGVGFSFRLKPSAPGRAAAAIQPRAGDELRCACRERARRRGAAPDGGVGAAGAARAARRALCRAGAGCRWSKLELSKACSCQRHAHAHQKACHAPVARPLACRPAHSRPAPRLLLLHGPTWPTSRAGALARWHAGGTLAARWRHAGGTLAARWRHAGTLARWRAGTLAARWRHAGGTLAARWHTGALARWHAGGTLAHWRAGALALLAPRRHAASSFTVATGLALG